MARIVEHPRGVCSILVVQHSEHGTGRCYRTGYRDHPDGDQHRIQRYQGKKYRRHTGNQQHLKQQHFIRPLILQAGKQIGARQEAGRIGGIGPCGRELCCATFTTNFVSVSTSAARFQDISLNPQKLAGQCAKLKCCLNYEVDAYVEKVFFGVEEHLNEIETMIEDCLVGWKKNRVSIASLAILRLGAYELMFIEDIPARVTINEGVELSKKFDDEKSYSFVNGVLNAMAEKCGKKDAK